MSYTDGFVLCVSNKKLAAYTRLSRAACKIWMRHGALEYRECAGDDLATPMGRPFTKLAGAKKGETVVFSWIRYKSRAHRDAVNAKAMKDPSMLKLCNAMNMPFDVKRMSYGGFRGFVEAST
jgi:uncharacterized protein YbaA (DUF1428 family)